MEYAEAMKAIVDSSASLTSWSLAVIGGSVAAIISTSYQRPASVRWRMTYLLYLVGWVGLGSAMYFGDRIVRRYPAALLSPDKVCEILRRMNRDFICQQDAFIAGLSAFGLWLFLYLVWWIWFSGSTNASNATES